MMIVTGSVLARPGALDQAIKVSLEHVRRSRTEPGCLLHSVHQDVEDPNRLVFLEHWSDRAALAAHFAVPESKAFVAALRAIAATAPTIEIYSVVADGRPTVTDGGLNPRTG